MNPRRRRGRRGRRRHRNPSFGFRGGNLLGIPLGEAASVAIGSVGTDILTGFVAKFVPLPGGPAGRIAAKALTVAGGSMLAKQLLGSRMAKAFALGGGVSIMLDIYELYVKPRIPGLAEYSPETLSLGSYGPEFSLGALTGDNSPTMWTPSYG